MWTSERFPQILRMRQLIFTHILTRYEARSTELKYKVYRYHHHNHYFQLISFLSVIHIIISITIITIFIIFIPFSLSFQLHFLHPIHHFHPLVSTSLPIWGLDALVNELCLSILCLSIFNHNVFRILTIQYFSLVSLSTGAQTVVDAEYVSEYSVAP